MLSLKKKNFKNVKVKKKDLVLEVKPSQIKYNSLKQHGRKMIDKKAGLD